MAIAEDFIQRLDKTHSPYNKTMQLPFDEPGSGGLLFVWRITGGFLLFLLLREKHQEFLALNFVGRDRKQTLVSIDILASDEAVHDILQGQG